MLEKLMPASFLLLISAGLVGGQGVRYDNVAQGIRGSAASNLNGIGYIDGVKYAVTDVGLAACLSAVGTNGTCVIPRNTSLTISKPVKLSTAFQTIQCDPGGQLTFINNIDGLNVNSNNITIKGCRFVGPGGSTGAVPILVNGGASYVKVLDNYFTGFANTGPSCVIQVPSRTASVARPVSYVWVQRNQFTGNVVTPICVYDQADHVLISDNEVSYGAVTPYEGIIVHAQDTGTAPTFVTIDHNMIDGAGGNCVEVGAFGGNAPTHVEITENICKLMASTRLGTGYSLSTVNNFKFSNNLFDANGFAIGTTANQPFECVNCVHGVVAANDAIMGAQSGSTGAVNGVVAIGINNGNTTDVTVTGNVVAMTYTGSSIASCYFSGASTAGTMSRIKYTANLCNLLGSTGRIAGINIQSNNLGAVVQNNQVNGNELIGAATATDGGIVIEKDFGTMSQNLIGQNKIYNFTTPISSNFRSPSLGYTIGTVDPIN